MNLYDTDNHTIDKLSWKQEFVPKKLCTSYFFGFLHFLLQDITIYIMLDTLIVDVHILKKKSMCCFAWPIPLRPKSYDYCIIFKFLLY